MGACGGQGRQSVGSSAPTLGEVFLPESEQLWLEASSQEEPSASSKNSAEGWWEGARGS